MSTAFRHIETKYGNRILIPCIIDMPNAGDSKNDEVMALWDTGATNTCISEELAQKLGLLPEDQKDLTMADNSVHTSNVYSIQITMGAFTMPYLRVCDLPMKNSGHDVIIGMDFMTAGDSTLSNYNGKLVLSFREPSLATVDYVEELERYKKMYEARRKVGNEKCPCGSGKLWKNCHGK